MGLLETIQSGVASAFAAVADLTELVTFSSTGTATVNVATGDVTRVDDENLVPVLIVPVKESRTIDLAGLSDVEVLVQGSYFTQNPQVGESFVRSDGSTWELVAVTPVPSNAMWVLRARRSASITA